MNWKYSCGAVILIAFGLLLSLILISRCDMPSIDIQRPTKNKGHIEFSIVGHHRINGIAAILIWSETSNENLWWLSVKATTVGLPALVNYGKTPARFKQTFPRDGLDPRGIAPSEVTIVKIVYDYDSLIAGPSSTSVAFRIKFDEYRRIKTVEKLAVVPQHPKGQW